MKLVCGPPVKLVIIIHYPTISLSVYGEPENARPENVGPENAGSEH